MCGNRLLFLYVLVLFGFAFPSFADLSTAGNVTSFQIAADQISFQLDSGAVARIELLDSDLVRIRVNPSGAFSSQDSGAVVSLGLHKPGAQITDNGDAVIAATSLATVTVFKSPFQVVILRPDGSTVSADAPSGVLWDANSGVILDQKIADPAEVFFGLGERGGPINRRGRSIVMHNVDNAGYGELADPLYISIPFYYGVLKGLAYGVFVDNPADPFFDMDSQQTGIVTFGARAGELNYYVLTGPEPSRVANTYARLTGFNQLPPKWSLGFHQSRYGYKSQDELLNIASQFRSLQIPCDALWMDIDYMDQMHRFTYNPNTFPSPTDLNSTLEKHGFNRVNIIEPLMRTDDPLWAFADQSGLFVTNPDGTSLVNTIWYGDVSFFDFSKDATRNWYKGALAGFLSAGTNGLWSDLNEPAQNFMPQATYDFGGQHRPDLTARNIYALMELGLFNEMWREAHPNDRFWAISRSGYSGIQRYSANWSGDTLSTFDSLRVSVQMTINMGFSGQNFFGHDIGGFLGSPSPELFTRWFEFGSYVPLFRNHSTDTADPREPWVFGEPYTTIIRNTTRQRYRLLPYLYSLFYQASTTGAPVIGPLPYYFPSDTNTYSESESFLLGPALLVAPVTTEGADSRSVYFPQGPVWYDYYTDDQYLGGTTAAVDAPLDNIPVFVRAGSIIPGGPTMQYVNDPNIAALLSVDVYPGPDGTFTLYEDDGKSMEYTLGSSRQTLFTHTSPNGWNVLQMQKSGGTFKTPSRPIYVYFHGISSAPSSVKINQIQLNPVSAEGDLDKIIGYYFDRVKNKLSVRIEDAASLQLTVIP
jgi:alpha-glucosidase